MKRCSGAIILDEKGRALLQLRDDIPGLHFANHWSLFGGQAESSEDPEATVKREIMEELGILLGDPKFFRQYLYEGKEVNVFSAKMAEHEKAGMRLKEGKGACFFGFEELAPLPLGFNMREILFDFYRELSKERVVPDRHGLLSSVKSLKTIACPRCGDLYYIHVSSAAGIASVKCSHCGFEYVNPVPSFR